MTETTAPADRTTRAQRMAMPLAAQVVRDLAVEHGDTSRTNPTLIRIGLPATRSCFTQRAEAQQVRDLIAAGGDDTADLDALITELDEEITKAGVRGKPAPAKPARRHRSTRRQDAPDLPAARSARAPSARRTPRRTARPSVRPCSSL